MGRRQAAGRWRRRAWACECAEAEDAVLGRALIGRAILTEVEPLRFGYRSIAMEYAEFHVAG